MMNQQEYRASWEAYVNIWKMNAKEERQAACAAALRQDCVYRDPLAECKGWDELIEYMETFHQQMPGGHFVTTDFQAHHGRSLASWNMVTGDGQIAGTGRSYATYAEDGKLLTMNGFFETQPETA